ncbi:LOW QUALITY PROTEIN: hypothetical protein PHMEG_0005001 [Phytophthora megakarya]|uniref:Reverse transcriptase domain-containing protein n=1 Tax=Phytophthora megakarya TaxID=4795 RepID=A0A225WSI4_9STRA|nr:LOW QUALITY PROTEIN: hypothetical protein PHMEG_0005001 [Phytophthora megakarya]
MQFSPAIDADKTCPNKPFTHSVYAAYLSSDNLFYCSETVMADGRDQSCDQEVLLYLKLAIIAGPVLLRHDVLNELGIQLLAQLADLSLLDGEVDECHVSSALHFQTKVQNKPAPLIPHSALVWVDDVILFAPTVQEFEQTLAVFFELVAEANFKVNTGKSSPNGVRHDPTHVNTLAELPLPATVADLQYFVFGTNWLSDSLPDYARVIEPQQGKLNAEHPRIGRRNATR